jgi:hypothetical protein
MTKWRYILWRTVLLLLAYNEGIAEICSVFAATPGFSYQTTIT